MNKNIKCILKYAFCVVAAVLLVLTFGACSSGEEAVTAIVSAQIKSNKEDVQIKATLSDEYLESHSGGRVYLLEMDSAYTESLEGARVVGSSKVKGKMTFKIDLANGFGSRLSSAFVLAELVSGDEDSGIYRAISQVAYLENPDIFSQNSSKPDNDSYKGLATVDIYEAGYLGASSILFEVAMNDLMLAEYSDGAVNYFFDGRSYYFDADAVKNLDKQVSEATAMGMRVYLRTVLKYPEKDSRGDFVKEPVSALYCYGSGYGKNGYLPSMNGEGSGFVRAFYDFLGSRYGEKNGAGQVYDYIIGENVNSYASNCNAGTAAPDRMMADYYSWVRVADAILSSYAKNTTVYVSLDNCLKAESAGGRIGCITFLEGVVGFAENGSDLDFAVSLDLGSGEDLSALLSGGGGSYDSVGVKNLSDFLSALDSDKLTKNGNRRRVIIDSLSLANDMSEKNRAAYYTYAYYKAASLGVDAFIYSANESGAALINSAGARSDFYYAYLMCGSSVNSQLKDYSDKISGNDLPSFGDHVSRKLTYEQSVRIEVSSSVGKNVKAFPVGMESFKIAGSAYNGDISLVKDKNGEEIQTLVVKGDVSDSAAAVVSVGVSAEKIIESGFVGITMSSPEDVKVALIISSDASGAAYVGEAEVSYLPETYFFNITQFTDNVRSSDSLTVTLCVLPDGESGDVELSVSELALYGSSGNGGSTLLTIIIVVVAVLGICGLLFLLTMKRRKKRSSRDSGSDD